MTSSKTSATSRRKKKTESQVTYLNGLYHRLNGVWDGSVRKEAMAATGLSRIQIYKWFFDRSMQDKSKKKSSKSTDSTNEETVNSSADIDSDNEESSVRGDEISNQPIFIIEKVVTRAE